MSDPLIDLIRCATLAPNGHNAQAWKFTLLGNAVQIHPDFTRRLPQVDPFDRELWISLGCALENLLTAARAAGFWPEVRYPDAADFIQVDLRADMPQRGTLFNMIPLRQVTRSVYDGRSVPAGDLDQMAGMAREPGVGMVMITDRAGIERVADYVSQGNQAQYTDKAFVAELIRWLRFNKKEAQAANDGLFTRATGNPEVPRWLGKLFVAGMKPEQYTKVDAKNLRSSAGVVVLTSETDDRAAWVRTGQVYERLALTMTGLNIKNALLNQPLEVAAVRAQFQGVIGPGAALPQLLLRFGYAAEMPRSLRRPVAEVLA